MPEAPGRDAIAAVLQQLLDDMPTLSRGIVRQIRALVHEYDRVPLGSHVDHVLEQQQRIIHALMEGRGLNQDDLRRAAALGRLRASQGVTVEGVISAYHVGNRELWRLIDERADRGREFLPELAATMWDAIHLTSTEIAAAHSSVARARHTHDLTMRHRFVELLGRGEDGAELLEVAGGLGFDTDGFFLAACISAGQRGDGGAQAIHEELEYLEGVSFAVQQGAVLLVLTQGPDAAALIELVEGLEVRPRAGIGLRRPGLDGARQSIRDAREVYLTTDEDHRMRSFADAWWQASVLAQSDRLELVLEPVRQAVLDNPHLAEAVRAYAESGFSVAAAAKALHVHANSVAYRLDRWRHITGWNPRDFTGLAHSLAACAIVQQRENVMAP